jgi:DNA-directed RNA polymerase specialized sigma24 family protein
MTGGEDAELMARYGSGDERAAHEVYERFAGRVMTVALGMLGKRDQAEEVVQETLLKLYRSAASYDGSRPLNPWVHQIARNAAIDVYRRDRRAQGDLGRVFIVVFAGKRPARCVRDEVLVLVRR